MRLTSLKSASICHHDCYINTNRPPQSIVSAPQWIWTVATALRGTAVRKFRHIRPHGNFMYSGVFDGWGIVPWHHLFVFIHYESIINEWWIINLQASIISPLIAMVKMFAVLLVARWRTSAFSQFCLQIALPYKKGNRKLIVPWSSFNTHRTTDNACACQSCDSRTVCTSWKYHGPLTAYIPRVKRHCCL